MSATPPTLRPRAPERLGRRAPAIVFASLCLALSAGAGYGVAQLRARTAARDDTSEARWAELADRLDRLSRSVDQLRNVVTAQALARPPAAAPLAATTDRHVVVPATGDPKPRDDGKAARQGRQIEHFKSAETMVRQAVDRGVWSEADRDALQQHLPMLHPEDAETLMTGLAVAINSQRLRVATPGPPF